MKINRFLLMTISMLLTNSINAQEFAMIGAEWHYTERYAFSGDQTFLKISSLKDTIIDGKNCRLIIKQGNPMCSGRPDVELMYQEDSVVYFWDATFEKFQTLFDLTKNPGEFWIIEVLDEGNDNNKDSIKITVNSNSIVEINGISLKQLDVTYNVLTENYPYSYSSVIIERIGDIQYLFNYYPSSSMACDGNYADGLRCYEDSQLGLYSTGIADSCDYIYRWTSIEEQSSEIDILVFPNPTTGQFSITSESTLEYSVELTDILSRKLKSLKFCMRAQFDISDFPNGLYFLLIKDDDNETMITAIVKY